MPMVAEHDTGGRRMGADDLRRGRSHRARLVRIKDTLNPTWFYASEALLPDIEADPRLATIEGFAPLAFDDSGRPLPRDIARP